MSPLPSNARMKGDSQTGGQDEAILDSRSGSAVVLLAICGLGVSAIITQLTLMRELLSAFSGNEMVLGIVLGNWLLLTGVGSYAGGSASKLKRPLSVLVVAQVLVAILPLLTLFALRTLRNVVFIRGALVGITETVISCFVLLLPYCLIAGYLLTLACRLLAPKGGPAGIGRVYFLDNIGDILGGVVFTFVLIHLFDHFGVLYLPAFLNLCLAAWIALKLRRRGMFAAVCVVAAALLAGILAFDPDGVSTRLQYSGRNVVYRGSSPYGDLVVTESGAQYDFIENGVPLFSTYDVEAIEQTVHYAMGQRPEAREVLLISGGVSGTAREILKYGEAKVDYVELDPLILDVGRRYVGENLADRRIRVINTDGRLFVKQTDRRYDVVIADLPDPSTSQLNRFYTIEFFQEVKRILTPGGVLSFSLGKYENYVSEESARLIAVAHKTLSAVFDNVTIIPSGRIFFLASDGELVRNVAPRIEERGIPTLLVKRSYLDAVLTPDRIADVERALSADARINEDLNPVLYYYHLLHWMSRFKFRFGILEGVLLVILAAYLFRIRPVPLAIFTTGFAASGLLMVLMLVFQILAGSVYHKVGLFVTVFMLGLAVGSLAMNRMLERRRRRDLVKLEFGIALFAALLPLVLPGLVRVKGGTSSQVLAQGGLPLLTFILAGPVGMEFPLAGKAHFKGVTTTAAQIYTADFVGACLGAMLMSTFLVPVIGVVWVCLLTAGLNCISGAVLWLTGRG